MQRYSFNHRNDLVNKVICRTQTISSNIRVYILLDECVMPTQEILHNDDVSSNQNEILIQLDVQRPIPSLGAGTVLQDSGIFCI